jgi:hypothetical protein
MNLSVEKDEPPTTRIDREFVRFVARGRLFGRSVGAFCIGRFEIHRRVGSGANGNVYAAYDPRLRREVAIKVLALRADEGKELLAEARAMARLSHPNVLTVYEAGVFEGAAFIVSELVDGGSMRDWISSPRSPGEKSSTLLAIARGLNEGHKRGLVHRDVKPENVLMGSDARPRVGDFGLALDLAADGSIASRAPLGTLRYMAPEVQHGARADARSDQFSFCKMAQEILQGDSKETPDSVLHPWFPVLRRGLSENPAERFPSMDNLIAAIDTNASRSGVRRSAVRSLVAALGLIGVSSGLAIIASGSSSPPLPSSTASSEARPSTQDPRVVAMLEQREIEQHAISLANSGRTLECAKYLETRANSETLILIWMGCARVSPDPGALDRACVAWNALPKVDGNPPPMTEECEEPLPRARRAFREKRYRDCVELIAAAKPKLMGYAQLVQCAERLRDSAVYQRMCRYHHALPGSEHLDPKECDAMHADGPAPGALLK